MASIVTNSGREAMTLAAVERRDELLAAVREADAQLTVHAELFGHSTSESCHLDGCARGVQLVEALRAAESEHFEHKLVTFEILYGDDGGKL